MLRSIFDKLLIGMGGAIATAIIFYASSWGAIREPTVDVTWISVPLPKIDNTVSNLYRKQAPALEQLLQTNLLPDVVDDLRYQSEIGLYRVKVSNRTDEVSKQIEIVPRDQVLTFAFRPKGSEWTVTMGRETIIIPPLKPGETAESLVVGKRNYFGELPVRVLHDGKLVQVNNWTIRDSDDVFGLSLFMARHPFVQYMSVVGSVGFICFLFAAIAFSALASKNLPAYVKLLGKRDMARFVRIADYIRATFPDRLPRDLTVPPAPPSDSIPPS